MSLIVAGIQTKVFPDPDKNLKKAVNLVEEAAQQGARIICLPELYRTIYFPQYKKRDAKKYAETIPGESSKTFAEIAREYGVVIIVPIFEKSARGYYNTAIVIDDQGRLLPPYRKTHIPFDKHFYEKNYFQPGDTGYRVYKTKYGNFAVLICYDQWFPEAARSPVLGGAEIIFYPTAIGYIAGYRSPDGDWHAAWQTVMRGHAIANGVHIVAVNRVGREGRLRFWGQSFACDSFGKIVAKTSSTKEEILLAKLDLAKNLRIREGWGFLKNRRPDTYEL